MRRFLTGAVLVLGLALLVAAVVFGYSATAPTARLAEAADQADAADVATTFAERSGAPGVAVVSVVDGVASIGVTGTDGAGAPVTEETPFRIGELSRALTAAAVGRLVDDGELSFDAKVAELLPDLRLAGPGAADLTVRQVLDQTSGLTAALDHAVDGAGDVAAAVTRLQGATLETEPGTEFADARANDVLAARLLEVVSGKGRADAVRSLVLGPLGLDRTTLTDRCEGAAEGLATGYRGLFGRVTRWSETKGLCLGAVTDARDMATWATVLSSTGKGQDGAAFLTESTVNALFTPFVGGHGMGFEVPWRATPDRIVRAETGATTTYSAAIAVEVDAQRAAVVLANLATDPGPVTLRMLDVPGTNVADRIWQRDALLLGASGLILCWLAYAHRFRLARRRSVPMLFWWLLVLAAGVAGPILARGVVGPVRAWPVLAQDVPLAALACVLLAVTGLAGVLRELRARGVKKPAGSD